MDMKTHFDLSFLEKSTETLRSIAHPTRITIIDLLFKNKRMTVTEIYEHLNIEQAVASHHLRILKDKRIVQVQREGKNSHYSLVKNDFHDIINVLIKVID